MLFILSFIDIFLLQLKELYIYILKKDTKELLEKYNFKIKYNKDNVQSNDKSCGVKKSTIEFLQALADLSSKKLNSKDIEISVEFLFNKGKLNK